MIEGPPRPYLNYIPEYLKESVGKWVTHKLEEPGLIEHVDSGGRKVYTVKAAATPNGRYSTDTMRKINDLARKYAGGSMRFTQALNMEFVVSDLAKARELKSELKKLGFPVGGWKEHLWSLTSCAGYFHCALAATDAPSVIQRLGNELSEYFDEKELPAKLTVAASGCPSSCGGSFLTDISINGIHTEIPVVTENVKNCDLQGTAFTCPVGAIQLKTLQNGEKTIEIRENLCIGCGLCVGACGGIIFKTPEKTDGHAISIGGKASASRYGTTLGRIVVPFLPNEPPHYEKTVKAVRTIVDTWIRDARKGERIADWVDRIGWEKFFEKTGLPFYPQSMDYLDIRAITTLRDGSGR
ncbi:MAG: sulfite reductase, dissimilatory-type beta subunit [Candidatus Thermoplasmatota archaeon]|jgi:sulfite reductase beta subunit|nr:sulfite reductase, dissimilatory-type beta subunit [Candidatus Thermoplasmatota archaeon]